MPRSLRVVMAGGGTAGHVVPGLSIARALVEGGLDPADVTFVGSRRGMEVEAVPAAGFALEVLPGRGIERRLTTANIRNSLDIARAVLMAWRILRRRRPDVVVSLGGYAAVPAAVSAVALRIPLVVQEQNARAGLANRLVGRFARSSAVMTEGVGLPREVVTGNPVRTEILDRAVDRGRERARLELGIPGERRVILAFGGSLGSRRINRAVLDLVGRWRDRTDLAVHHVVGRRDWESLQPEIAAAGGGGIHYRAVEYEHRMPEALAACDVAVCRSGGSTVAELAVIGVPAVLVPLPIAANDHQTHNARTLAAVGAAIVVPDSSLDGERLMSDLEEMLGSDLTAMERAARSVGRPDAADRVARLVVAAAVGSPAGPHR